MKLTKRNIIIIVVILIIIVAFCTNIGSEFVKGFQDGFKATKP